MFENFNLNRKVFVEEQILVRLLHRLAKGLPKFTREIRYYLLEYYAANTFSVLRSGNIMCKLRRVLLESNKTEFNVLSSFVSPHIHNQSNETTLYHIDSNFPTKFDYEGAVKAMVILHNTFSFDLYQMSFSLYNKSQELYTNISYHDAFRSKTIAFPTRERLSIEDFVVFTECAAYFFNFYAKICKLRFF